MADKPIPKFPTIATIERGDVSSLLRSIPQWILWRAGPLKDNGKFDKIPTHPKRDHDINPHDPKNWMSWEEAINAHDRGVGSGLGFVMTTDRILPINGEKFHLVALDYDNCSDAINEVKEDWLRLGKPYVEVSPSGQGVRMFALSKDVLKGGNNGQGREMYFKGQFLTVTGRGARGEIKDASAGIAELHKRWFGKKAQRDPGTDLGSNIAPPPPPETTENIERVKAALQCVSADTDYEAWRNIVWSILSTEWACAEGIAREWSRSVEQRPNAQHKFDDQAFDNLIRSFKPGGGITIGSLFHHAQLGGWTHPGRGPELLTVDNSAFAPTPRLLTATQIKAQPNTSYLVKGLLPARGVAAIYGESGSGKSFLAMDLCFSIAAGLPDWFGMKIKEAPVAYVALEGRGGISKRIKAWEKHNKQIVGDKVRFVVSDFTLLNVDGVAKLGAEILAALGPGCIVVVDTLNQSAPGADENSSKDMNLVLANAKQLGEHVQGAALLVHHTGKDPKKGMRGHSSLLAAMDAVIVVTKSSEGKREWNITKAKDDDIVASRGFELVNYVVGADDDGDDITSCAVRPTLNIPKPARKPISGKNQIAAMAHLRQVMAGGVPSLSYENAKTEVAAILTTIEVKRRGTRAKELVDALISGGHLNFDEEGMKITLTE